MARRRRRKRRSSGIWTWALQFRPVRLVTGWLVATIILGLSIALLESAIVGPQQGGRSLLLFVAVYVVAAYVTFRLWRRYQRRRRLRIREFNQLLALTPSQFEVAIAHLLHDMGYGDVQRVGGPGDLAADIVCRGKKGERIAVQCKRYAPGSRVGSRDIQAFIGMLAVHHRADAGIFITTSEFTGPAANLAKQHGIMLLDGPRLRRLIDKKRVRNEDLSLTQVSEHTDSSPPPTGQTVQ